VTRNGVGGFLQHGHGGHDLSGSAVAALEAVALHEGSLHGVKLFSRGETFNGGDLILLVRNGERQARQGAAPVDMDRTGTALPVIAALLTTRQVEVVTKGV